MSTKIILPTLGESISDAVLVRWLKKEGDAVQRGEEIAELETAKANIPLECPINGILLKIVVEEGKTVITGQLLAIVGSVDETVVIPEELQPFKLQKEPKSISSEEVMSSIPSATIMNKQVSPLARRRAEELGIDINLVISNIPKFRITSEDVERYATEHQVVKKSTLRIPYHRMPINTVHRTVAQKMVESAREIPQFSVELEVEVDRFSIILEELNALTTPKGVKVSVTSLLAYLAARVIQKHPLVNARYHQDGILVYDTINIAVAISTLEGLTSPVIYGLEHCSLTAIACRLAEITERAKTGKLVINDVNDSTFTLSNLGMHGVIRFVPLINPPHAAILGVSAIRPVVIPQGEDGIRQAHVIGLVLVGDHRVLDGVYAAEFLYTLKDVIENCQVDQIAI